MTAQVIGKIVRVLLKGYGTNDTWAGPVDLPSVRKTLAARGRTGYLFSWRQVDPINQCNLEDPVKAMALEARSERHALLAPMDSVYFRGHLDFGRFVF